MTTQAAIGHGIHFARGDGDEPEVFTNIAEVYQVTPPSLSRDPVQATHTDSPDAIHEYIAGMGDAGEASITMNFLPGHATQGDSAGGLMNDWRTSHVGNYRITFPAGTTWTFRGMVTGFETDAPIEDRMTATATFKVMDGELAEVTS